MHLIFSHYFQSFYSIANDFHPQQLQIRLAQGRGAVGLHWTFKWIKHIHRHTNGQHGHASTHTCRTARKRVLITLNAHSECD